MEQKVCVIIPCKGRERSLAKRLPSWIRQSYPNKQIVIVDYDSSNLYSNVARCCYGLDLAYNEPFSNADVLVLRVENKPYFNMSHAINYAIRRTESDIISIAGAETLPEPGYLDIAIANVKDNQFARCIRGRLTFPRKFIEEINGYPELMEYWGGEDDVVIYQFKKLGYNHVDLDYALADNIQNAPFATPIKGYYEDETIKFRRDKVKNKFEGAMINLSKMGHYIQEYNVNNFGEEFGEEEPKLLQIKDEDLKPNKAFRGNIVPSNNPRFVNKRIAVMIDAEDSEISLTSWISQPYQNKQIVVCSKNDDAIKRVKRRAKINKIPVCDLDLDAYDYDAGIVISSGCDSVAAAERIKTDVILFTTKDALPIGFFLDMIMNTIDEDTEIVCGESSSITYHSKMEKLNPIIFPERLIHF